MLSQFGIEASRAAQYIIAFAIILVLVALFGLVLRKLTGGRMLANNQDRSRARQPRLGVVDIYDLDRQRQLVLLRRDNVEHLLLIGGLNDVVIETNIVRVAGGRIPAPSLDQPAERYEPVVEPSRPQVETPGRPSIETQLAAQLGAFVKRPPEEAARKDEGPPLAPTMASRPEAPPEAPVYPKAPSVEAPRPESRPPGFSAGPRPVAAPPPAPEPRRSFIPPLFQSRPTPHQPASPPPRPVHPADPELEVAQAPEERTVPDEAVLSDMAKQLEAALKRPGEASADELRSVAIEDNPDLDDDLLEPLSPVDEPDEPEVPQSIAGGDHGPVEPQPVAPASPPLPAEPASPANDVAAAPAEPSAVQPPKDKVPDPFSVEEIEAEFARLLGRPLDGSKKG